MATEQPQKIWGPVPPRNRHFTGRAELLESLSRSSGVTAITPVALQGLGGVGKSLLAVEYAHRRREDYDLVWWMLADRAELVAASLASLALRLGLPARAEAEESARAVIDMLRQDGGGIGRWLLVFDNADDPNDLLEWIPYGPGHVIVTTRNTAWATRSEVERLEVPVFNREESREFLGKRVGGLSGEDGDRLAEALGDLPIALDYAASYQIETAISVDDYLRVLKDKALYLTAEGQQNPLVATWMVSVAQVRKTHPEAGALLELLAFFGPDPISRDVLSSRGPGADDSLQEILGDPLKLSAAMRALARYALIQIDVDNRSVSMHRLVQQLLRETAEEATALRLRARVVGLLAAATPKEPDDVANWAVYERLWPHVCSLDPVKSSDRAVRMMLRCMVRYLYQAGHSPAAVELARACVVGWTADPGTEKEDLFAMRRHLGNALRGAGDLRGAYLVNEEALADAERQLPEEHDERQRLSLSHCIDLRYAGRFVEALELSRVLAETVSGEGGVQALIARNGLGLNLLLAFRDREGRELLTRVRADLLAVAGPNHPQTQITMNNLIRAIRFEGEWEDARAMGMDLLAADTQLLGPDHPGTLLCSKDLAITCRLLEGGSAEAVDLATSLLPRFRTVFGERHINTAAMELTAANALRAAGGITDALPLVQHAGETLRERLTEDHPYSLIALDHLALLIRLLGDPEDAVRLHGDVAQILSASLGETHPWALTSVLNRAGHLAALGDHQTAAEIGAVAVGLVAQGLGSDSPMGLIARYDLTLDLAETGADVGSERAETIRLMTRRLTAAHPWTVRMSRGERVVYDADLTPL